MEKFIKKNNYILGKTFDLFFSLNLSLFFIKTFRGFCVIKLPAFFLFKKVDGYLAFLFLQFYFFKSLLHHFIVFYNKLFCLYYSKLKLKG
jgi:hypothetical protein